jgi:8-oxo-dGTP pyrophosphatase MutT (NUDIX family)
MDGQPEYACALISDHVGRLLLQLRPSTSHHAPSQLTCFGGRRESDEDAVGCLRRELDEELGWVPFSATTACDLRRGPRWIARFFACTLPRGTTLRVEAGSLAVPVPWRALPGLPVSPWHQAVLAAIAAGSASVDLNG